VLSSAAFTCSRALSSENPAPNFEVHPALVLGVYGEELANGARAAIFGSSTLGLAEELVLRGARLVHVYDTDAGRVAEATAQRHDRSIFYGALPDSGDVGVRDGAFDFVVVPDLSFAADKAALLALVRRVLSPSGAALIASPNAESTAPLIVVPETGPALGYYELYEAVAEHFTHVRMLGQAPFVGYAVAEFSVEDPEPTIDTSLAESEGKEPDWFVVLASDRTVRLDPFALIELPKEARSGGAPSAEDPRFVEAPGAEPASASTSEGRGTVLVNILEAEREAALESLRQQEQIVKEERFRADHATTELTSLREELGLARERCRAAEQRLEQEETRRSALEVEVERARHSPELGELRDRVQRLDASSAGLTEEHERDIARFEAQLKARGKEVQELRSEVDRRDKLVRELIATNLALPAEPAASNGHEGVIADLSARLDRLAADSAKREADLQAARWKIAQLERERAEQR
jgi:hypothetical protein